MWLVGHAEHVFESSSWPWLFFFFNFQLHASHCWTPSWPLEFNIYSHAIFWLPWLPDVKCIFYARLYAYQLWTVNSILLPLQTTTKTKTKTTKQQEQLQQQQHQQQQQNKTQKNNPPPNKTKTRRTTTTKTKQQQTTKTTKIGLKYCLNLVQVALSGPCRFCFPRF